ncbi:oxalate decarboxylase family bicupin protein [Rutstroemia sp. NJR-2017a BVV2]|nr:oxalate decarboxylase family bicupin protein [Rutstroemia sp. NJR-2017a BVV2]
MPELAHLLAAFVVAGLLPAAFALPTPQMSYGEQSVPEGGVTSPVPTVTAPTGSLYGPDSLRGEIVQPSPISGGDSAIVSDYPLVSGQEADADLGLFLDFNGVENPQPIRGTLGQTDPGPQTYEYQKLNPDTFAPSGTDSGSVPQAKWPMGLSHNKFGSGKTSGWARQQNTGQLPSATAMAGVDMRLAPHAYRELHWHTANEWALMLKGSVRLSAINEKGESFIDDISAGDVWYFPAGVPHSIQALEEGCEFLLVFDQGDFTEYGTFLATEMFLRNPKSVLSKNLQTPVSAFDNLPSDQLYIFDGTPAPANISEQNITSSAGIIPQKDSYTYHWSQQQPYTVPGGSVKLIDTTTFPAAANFAAALVTIEPGAMREMHWHLTSDEWNFFLQGSARITVYAAPSSSNTFDFTAGDVGYIPASNTHYIENTGTEDVVFLEVLQQPVFSDISVAQWLALTPRQVIKDTLGLPDSTLDALPKEKTYLKTGNANLTALASDPSGSGAYQS